MHAFVQAPVLPNLPSLLEAAMLACFGLAWPLANLRMWRTRRAEGKGLAFTLVILCGYAAGAVAKALSGTPTQALPPLFWFYLLNGSMVAINLSLQWRFQQGRARLEGRAAGEAPRCASIGGGA